MADDTPRVSPLAAAAAATGVLAMPLLPALLGLAALSGIAASNGRLRGAGLARAGIALGVAWFVLEAAALGVFLTRPEALLRRLYRERIETGEAAAPRALRIVARQQESARASDLDGNGVHDYWTRDIAGLYRMQMARHGRPDIMGVDVASADSASEDGSRPAPYEGYLLRTVPAGDSLSHFAATAFPRTYGEDGFLTFYIDESGSVWARDLHGGAATSRMEEPDEEGWRLVAEPRG